ncbi:MAG: hypothetical protein E6H53_02990 [Betaproteobacteria bacterium]|nr:MAG: hypothetical protein E6H53_02990 [Betaproteobacteria bacterium]
MRRFARSVACLAVLTAAPALAQTITFDFDSVPGGTVVDTIYASQGLTLSRTAGGSICNNAGQIFANGDRPAGFTISSAPNVVSQCSPPQASDVSENNFGAIRADLSSAASQVCINVFPDTSGDSAILRVYDAGANFLTSATSAAGAMQTLCVSVSGIRRAEFSGSGTTFARFDDLAVTFVRAPLVATIVTPVPTASVWMLAFMAAALAAVGWLVLRRA